MKTSPKPIPALNPKQILKFWQRVEKTDSCWLWSGCIGANGYGLFYLNGKQVLSHRVSYLLHSGGIPDGKFVLHNCPSGDNPKCVNPAHLWIGTNKDNMIDKCIKGRANAPRGERSAFSKLTEDGVKEIRQQVALGVSQTEMAIRFGINTGTVCRIVHGEKWKHVPLCD